VDRLHRETTRHNAGDGGHTDNAGRQEAIAIALWANGRGEETGGGAARINGVTYRGDRGKDSTGGRSPAAARDDGGERMEVGYVDRDTQRQACRAVATLAETHAAALVKCAVAAAAARGSRSNPLASSMARYRTCADDCTRSFASSTLTRMATAV